MAESGGGARERRSASPERPLPRYFVTGPFYSMESLVYLSMPPVTTPLPPVTGKNAPKSLPHGQKCLWGTVQKVHNAHEMRIIIPLRRRGDFPPVEVTEDNNVPHGDPSVLCQLPGSATTSFKRPNTSISVLHRNPDKEKLV